MKLSLDRPQIIKDAEKTFCLYSGKNKVITFILEALLALGVFYFVELTFSIVATIGTAFIWGVANSSQLSSLAANGEIDIEAINEAIYSWDFFTPITLNLEVIMTLLVLLIAKFYQKRKVSTVGFVKKNAFTQYLIGMALGFVLFSVAELLCVVTSAVKITYDPSTFQPILFIVYFVGWLFQGMAEEVLCRGFIMVSFARKFNLLTAVLFNSLFFAALHLGNSGISPLAFVNLTLFGIFASIVFIKTGNIWLVSAMHSIWNMVQGNLYGVLVSGGDSGTTILSTIGVAGKELMNGGDFGLEGGLAVSIVYVIGIIIALLLPSRKAALPAQDKVVSEENAINV